MRNNNDNNYNITWKDSVIEFASNTVNTSIIVCYIDTALELAAVCGMFPSTLCMPSANDLHPRIGTSTVCWPTRQYIHITSSARDTTTLMIHS